MATTPPTVNVNSSGSGPIIRVARSGADLLGDVIAGFIRGAQSGASNVGTALKKLDDPSNLTEEQFFAGAPSPQPEVKGDNIYLAPAPPVRASYFDAWYNAFYRIPGHGYKVSSDTVILARRGGFA